MKDKLLEADGTAIYLKAYREAEKEAAYHLVRLLRSPGNTYNIERELEAVLAKSKMTLAQKQEEAVRMVFRSQVSIITGGPGFRRSSPPHGSFQQVKNYVHLLLRSNKL